MILGKDLIEKEFRKFGMAAVKYVKGTIFDEFLKEQGLSSLDDMYVRVGYGRLEPRLVVDRLNPERLQKENEKSEDDTFMEKVLKSASQSRRRKKVR